MEKYLFTKEIWKKEFCVLSYYHKFTVIVIQREVAYEKGGSEELWKAG
jgi:hypothetical protein